jgi:hypothetical protein
MQQPELTIEEVQLDRIVFHDCEASLRIDGRFVRLPERTEDVVLRAAERQHTVRTIRGQCPH